LNQYISIKCADTYFHFIIFPFTLASTVNMLTKEFEEMIEVLENDLKMHIGQEEYYHIHTKSVAIEYIDQIWKGSDCVER
jgi:hypothetical protein